MPQHAGPEHERRKDPPPTAGVQLHPRTYGAHPHAAVRTLLSTVEQTSSATDAGASEGIKVSVVLPCLNEAASIERCVERARDALQGQGWQGEVIVSDNGSEDLSADLATRAGALVVH